MKKIFVTAIFYIAAFIPINAQVNIRAEILAILRSKGYDDISEERYAYLKEGEDAQHWRTFYAGVSYAIVAYTEDAGVRDIDVYLYDTDGTVLVKDTEEDIFAIVYYTPYVTRRMRVVIKNYDSLSQFRSYKCKFIIAY